MVPRYATKWEKAISETEISETEIRNKAHIVLIVVCTPSFIGQRLSVEEVYIAQAFTDAANLLTLCGANVNPEKFVFAQDTVQFAGGLTTVKPARKFTKAIAEFPIPTDVRSW